MFRYLLVLALLTSSLSAQIQRGAIRGTVLDPTAARVRGAKVTLDNPLASSQLETETDAAGEFQFNNLPYGIYQLGVSAPGFRRNLQARDVHSNIPQEIEVALEVGAPNEAVEVRAADDLLRKDSSSTATDVGKQVISAQSVGVHNRELQSVVSTVAGSSTENNGLVHFRGVDDGILYVLDGIPIADRLDSISASPPDLEGVNALEVITGNIPAEFGGRSGAVVVMQSQYGAATPLRGAVAFGGGSFGSRDLELTASGGTRKLGLTGSASLMDSERFLDPVHPANFNNYGAVANLNLRMDWHPRPDELFVLDLTGDGSNFDVPNTLEQALAGQEQRQQLRDDSQSLKFQHLWSSVAALDLAVFRRRVASKLLASENDVPLSASQNRSHTRTGAFAGLAWQHRRHTLKFGGGATRVDVGEFFGFHITDPTIAAEQEISPAALTFTADNPFVFQGSRTGSEWFGYVQDNFSPISNLNLALGARFERSTLPVRDHQISPRVGAVYYVPKTRTAVRASFNRLYMPPQIENLLLADSAQARALSPFAESGGGAPIHPEKVSAYEIGFSQAAVTLFRLDVAQWWRSFTNFDDPNVFFNTTVVFPNSVSEGWARGVDVRLDVLQRRGWAGYLSYTNARILQIGPINGGLFLTNEFIEIGPGTRFVPDHDQRNVGSAGITYSHKKGWASLSGRHESGVPLGVDEDRLEELRSAPGAELVNFARGRVKPWTVWDFAAGTHLLRRAPYDLGLEFGVQNITNRAFVYNFGSPFEGTHFGRPRMFTARLRVALGER